MIISIKNIVSQVLIAAQQWEYQHNSNVIDPEQSRIARHCLRYTIEAYSEILPLQRKIINSDDFERLIPNQISFSLKKKSCATMDVDFDFDILSISSIKKDQNARLMQVTNNEYQFPMQFTYSILILADRQVLFLHDGYASLEILGRFMDFDICSIESENSILDLPVRYLKPIIEISAYEFCKAISNVSLLESLKAINDEAIDALKKLRDMG